MTLIQSHFRKDLKDILGISLKSDKKSIELAIKILQTIMVQKIDVFINENYSNELIYLFSNISKINRAIRTEFGVGYPEYNGNVDPLTRDYTRFEFIKNDKVLPYKLEIEGAFAAEDLLSRVESKGPADRTKANKSKVISFMFCVQLDKHFTQSKKNKYKEIISIFNTKRDSIEFKHSSLYLNIYNNNRYSYNNNVRGTIDMRFHCNQKTDYGRIKKLVFIHDKVHTDNILTSITTADINDFYKKEIENQDKLIKVLKKERGSELHKEMLAEFIIIKDDIISTYQSNEYKDALITR